MPFVFLGMKILLLLLLLLLLFLFDSSIVHGASFKYNIHTILTHGHVTLKWLFYLTVASGHPLTILARFFDNSFLRDHITTFKFNANIPNINLHTLVFARITYGSKNWAESVEIDWIGRLKRRITDIKANR